MARFDWRNKVERDYRERILVDPDSPILASRANRDRCTSVKNRSEYAGLSHLGTCESNDAIIWNVFRYLQKAGRLDIITDELGIGEPRGLLLWALAPELDGKNAELQFVTGDLTRRFDMTFSEGVPEPDVTILGTTGIAVGIGVSELGEGAKYLWGGMLEQVGQSRALLNKYPGFIKQEITGNELIPVYQLVKLALLAKELGAHFGVEPVVTTLASTKRFFTTDMESGKSAADWWGTFVGMLGENAIKCKPIVWQEIPRLRIDPSVLVLSQHLLTHPYLYDLSDRFYAWDSAAS